MKAFAWKSESRANRRGVLLEKGEFKEKWRINHLCVILREFATCPGSNIHKKSFSAVYTRLLLANFE
jgi:hypothetical protein